MQTFTLELADDLFRGATEVANAMGVTLNEYVVAAIVASLASRRADLLDGVRDDLGRYSEVVECLGSH